MPKKRKHGASKSTNRRDNHKLKLRSQRRAEYIAEQKQLSMRKKKHMTTVFKLWAVYSATAKSKMWQEPCYFHDDETNKVLEYVGNMQKMGLDVAVAYVKASAMRTFWFDPRSGPSGKAYSRGLERLEG